jgi:glycine dehydrogenase subunit 1
MKKFYTDSEIDKLISEIGIDSVDRLYTDIPDDMFVDLDLMDGMDEEMLFRNQYRSLKKNKSIYEYASFLGDGFYNHYVPPIVDELVSRSEFLTAYTPYQPEINQGVLKALFEYQSMVTELSDMEVSNSSMYDGASALGEACRFSARIHEGDELIIPASMSPVKKAVIKNYIKGMNINLVEAPFDVKTGKIIPEKVKKIINDKTIGMVVQSPNRFGIIENITTSLRDILGNRVYIFDGNPLSLALLKTPGEVGADVYVGEGSIFGSHMNCGGPLIGIFSTKKEYIRKMPGRIIGATHDVKGKQSFCMTLQTREQHIKREHATSNICTNNALIAIAFGIYLSIKGPDGLKKVAIQSVKNAHKLSERIASVPGFIAPYFTGEFFNEFVYKTPFDTSIIINRLFQKKIFGGIAMTDNEILGMGNVLISNKIDIDNSINKNYILSAATEMNTENEIDLYAKVLRDINVSSINIR